MYRTLDDLDLKDKDVLLRVDYNVPMKKDGTIETDVRIRESLPTIRKIVQMGARKIVLCSHFGRPKAGVFDAANSLKPVYERLAKLTTEDVGFEPNFKLRELRRESLPPAKLVLLENLRFDAGEEGNDPAFCKALASLADVFVFDAFGASHRAHASVTGVAEILPGAFGLLMQKEVRELKERMDNPDHPFTAIIGGAKADKISVISNLLKRVDYLIVGGVLANTFLKAKGMDISASKFDKDSLDFAKQVLSENPGKVVLPVDVMAGNKFEEGADAKAMDVTHMEQGWMAMDIGPRTISMYKDILSRSKTIVWAGPIGVFEFQKFSTGTLEVAKAMADSGAKTIIGGGDSVAAIEKFELQSRMTHVSTGGGASLELLGGNILPAMTAMDANYKRFGQKPLIKSVEI